MIDLYFLEDIALFLDIFSGYHSGGIIIAIILWLILTIYSEIMTTQD